MKEKIDKTTMDIDTWMRMREKMMEMDGGEHRLFENEYIAVNPDSAPENLDSYRRKLNAKTRGWVMSIQLKVVEDHRLYYCKLMVRKDQRDEVIITQGYELEETVKAVVEEGLRHVCNSINVLTFRGKAVTGFTCEDKSFDSFENRRWGIRVSIEPFTNSSGWLLESRTVRSPPKRKYQPAKPVMPTHAQTIAMSSDLEPSWLLLENHKGECVKLSVTYNGQVIQQVGYVDSKGRINEIMVLLMRQILMIRNLSYESLPDDDGETYVQGVVEMVDPNHKQSWTDWHDDPIDEPEYENVPVPAEQDIYKYISPLGSCSVTSVCVGTSDKQVEFTMQDNCDRSFEEVVDFLDCESGRQNDGYTVHGGNPNRCKNIPCVRGEFMRGVLRSADGVYYSVQWHSVPERRWQAITLMKPADGALGWANLYDVNNDHSGSVLKRYKRGPPQFQKYCLPLPSTSK